MTASHPLSARLAAGETIVIDGGTGTEIERRGGTMVHGVWSGVAALSHPDAIQAVHEDFIRRGAELIIANTYACSRHLLERSGYGDEFEHLNRVGIELARAAREATGTREEVAVAGSISTTQMGGEQPPLDVARANYSEQARIQADAGADLIVLEMMRDITHTQIALDAVYATGLPVWSGYSCVLVDGEPWLFNRDVRLHDGLVAIAGQPIELVAVMHTEIADTDPCLDVIQDLWDGPVGAYAQMGRFESPHWIYEGTITPAEYAQVCARWIDRGVQVIGGCCGIGPEHIAGLRELRDARSSVR